MQQPITGYFYLFTLLFFSTATGYCEELGVGSAPPFPPSIKSSYSVNPGDVLSVFVWNEPTLSNSEVLVMPDGFINIAMMGAIQASGYSTSDIATNISEHLRRYLQDTPTVTVSVISQQGNVISILGKVTRPGQFVMRGATDVTQALAMAGGLTTFADDSNIKILRRDQNGVQTALEFNYGRVAKGRDLQENLMLRSGDVVIVP